MPSIIEVSSFIKASSSWVISVVIFNFKVVSLAPVIVRVIRSFMLSNLGEILIISSIFYVLISLTSIHDVFVVNSFPLILIISSSTTVNVISRG